MSYGPLKKKIDALLHKVIEEQRAMEARDDYDVASAARRLISEIEKALTDLQGMF